MNYINLDNLPRKNNKIDWQSCNNVIVNFEYNNNISEFIIVKHLDVNHVLVEFNNIQIVMSKISIVHCALGKLYNFSVKNNYKYKIGDIINSNKRNLQIISLLRQGRRKSYNVLCKQCDNNYMVTENNLNLGKGCPFCSGRKANVGINNIRITHPQVVKFLLNDSDADKYTSGSNKLVDLKCPICNKYIGQKMVYDLCRDKISCKYCGDKISYPNKFMANLLFSLNVNFDTEVKFDWCKFLKYNSNKYSFGIYDFVLPEHSLIIEMDSGLGHGNNIYSKSNKNKDELIYIDKIKSKLAIEHNYNIIRIKCDYYGHADKFIICKNAILQSKLNNYINLSNVDWFDIDKNCLNSFVVKACELYNSGKSASEIAIILKKANSTIIDYLHKGTNVGICNFIPYKNKMKNN